jgi:hypothetical protein
LWRMFDRSKALPRQACHGRQASLRVVFFGHPGFVGVGEWEVVAGRDVDLEVGEQAGDVGESGGAASGDVAAGEEPKEMGEGMVDALGGLEVFGAVGEQVGEVVGIGGGR